MTVSAPGGPWMTRVVLVRRAGEEIELRAPAVGWWRAAPPVGTVVGPGDALGEMLVLGTRTALVLPDDAHAGRIVARVGTGARTAVAYGEVLCRLGALALDGGGAIRDGGAGPDATDVPEGFFGVRAATAGVFYARPGPDRPPFVEAGSALRLGDPLGLVEVMKTFNPIAYGGDGAPETAVVEDVRVRDGDEIHAGQVLFVVRGS